MKILENKYLKENEKISKPRHSENDSVETRFDSKFNMQTPFSDHKSGVASDFLKIPMTSPKQFFKSGNMISDCDEDT